MCLKDIYICVCVLQWNVTQEYKNSDKVSFVFLKKFLTLRRVTSVYIVIFDEPLMVAPSL